MSAMLEVKDLVVSYGKIKAVKGISFSVDEGEVVTLIGTNGAGKTTTLRTISGLIRPSAGSIRFQGKRIENTAAHDIVSLGIAQSPEGRRIFPRLSVEQNLRLGAFSRRDRVATPHVCRCVVGVGEPARVRRGRGSTDASPPRAGAAARCSRETPAPRGSGRACARARGRSPPR